MFQPLDGPAKQFTMSVNTTTPQEVKVTTALEDRQVVTIQPTDGKIWVYFGDGSTPLAATIVANGFPQVKNSFRSYEAGPRQPLWILSQSGTVTVKIAERA